MVVEVSKATPALREGCVCVCVRYLNGHTLGKLYGENSAPGGDVCIYMRMFGRPRDWSGQYLVRARDAVHGTVLSNQEPLHPKCQ